MDRDFEIILEDLQEKRTFTARGYKRTIPVQEEWAGYFSSNAVFNVDPVRILFYTKEAKEKLRVVDLFRRMDTDDSTKISRHEIAKALRVSDR